MNNNTSVSGITKPNQYTLLDNNHKYLPRDFTFIPTVSSDLNDNVITETVENALDNTYYYTCTPQDFVYNIEVNGNLENVVYKTKNKSACVYKISSEGNDVYKYCEDTAKVSIQALYNNGVNNIDISNVTVTKGKFELKPIAKSLSYTVSDDKKIIVPKDYSSFEINSSDVYFRQESSLEESSWVTINNNIVLFSNDIEPTQNIIRLFDNNFEISLNDSYICNNMVEVDLEYAYTELNSYNSDTTQKMPLVKALAYEIKALVKTALKDTSASLNSNTKEALNKVAKQLLAANNLGNAATDLGNAATYLESAATDLGNAATYLKSAATDLKSAADDLGSAADDLVNASLIILNTSLSLKRKELLVDNKWKKIEKVSSEEDRSSLNSIINNFSKDLSWDNKFADSFSKLDKTYVIYNNKGDDIGFMDMSENIVVVIDTEKPVLKEILNYYFNNINDSNKIIGIVALDENKEMIIYKDGDTYKLVYRDTSITESILPDKDSFLYKKKS